MNGKNVLKISRKDLKKYETIVEPYFINVSWTIDDTVAKKMTSSADFSPYATAMAKSRSFQQQSVGIKIVEVLQQKFGFPVMPKGCNAVLNTIKNGALVANYVAEKYGKSSGLSRLYQIDDENGLSTSQSDELNKKENTLVPIYMFTLCSYVIQNVSHMNPEKRRGMNLNIGQIPEIVLTNQQDAFSALLYYFGTYIKESEAITTENAVVQFAQQYFQSIIDHILTIKGSLEYTKFFENVTYNLEGSQFILNGFSKPSTGASVKNSSIEPLEMEAIVGNPRAKHFDVKTSQMLALYDPALKWNPLTDKRLLGDKFPKLVGLWGPPGTGKTMAIKAKATKLLRYAEKLGKKCYVIVKPKTGVSSMQGETAILEEEFWAVSLIDDAIVVVFVDDASSQYPDRSGKNVSEGNRSQVEIALTVFDGSSSKNLGGFMTKFYDNHFDSMDSALLSRFVMKERMEGPLTKADWLDLFYLQTKDIKEGLGKFYNYEEPKGHTFMKTQSVPERLQDLLTEEKYEIRDTFLAELVAKVDKKYRITQPEYLAELEMSLRKRHENYTARIHANAHAMAKVQTFDFLFPEDWFQDPKYFDLKPAKERVQMVLELRKQATDRMFAKGISYATLISKEIIRQADNLIRIESVEIEKTAKQRIKNAQAHTRFLEMSKEQGIEIANQYKVN